VKTTDADLVVSELDPIQKRIGVSEVESVPERWAFGNVLLKYRVGKQLPHGMRAGIIERFHLESSEMTRRMQLAYKFSTREEVVDASTRCGSWRRLIREELTKTPRKRKESAWVERAEARLDKLMREAGESDERHDALVGLLKDALAQLDTDMVEVTL